MASSRTFLALGLLLAFCVALGARLTGFAGPDEAVAGDLASHLVPAHAAGEPAAAATLLPAVRVAPSETVTYADTLRQGETLSELLSRARLAAQEVRVLMDELLPHQDPRRIRPGFVVTYLQDRQDGATRRIEAHLDRDRRLALERDGAGWTAGLREVAVQADTVALEGEVRSSLYAALLRGSGEEAGISVRERERIADVLADGIFAWQIDFARDLRRGDRYRILYERLVRPDGTAREGRVLAVELSVNNRDYHAYHFSAGDGTRDYFDRDGSSLRSAFLRAPLDYRRVSSVFTSNRLHPITGRNRPHNGVDYAASTGTPVRAAGDGTVQRAGRHGGYGNLVDIRHARGYMTRYAHLNGFAPGITPGTRVRQGDVIGYVGMTGLATGPHLHYEFHTNGRPVDPRTEVPRITGEPVPDRHRSAFLGQVAGQIALLNASTVPVLAMDGARDDRGSSVAMRE
jgi:murein DD-endopeptidase MepM/ murein hydrolase activator NlpD